MPRGRKPLNIRPVQLTLSLPGSLMAEVDKLLFDPMTGGPAYGARAKLVTRFLRQWVLEQKGQAMSVATLIEKLEKIVEATQEAIELLNSEDFDEAHEVLAKSVEEFKTVTNEVEEGGDDDD